MDRRLRVPTPAGRFQHAAGARLEVGEIGLTYGFRREMRMDVDRHVEIDSRRQQAVVARMVEEAALGRAIDERADKPEFLHRARKFHRRSVRRLHRQHGKSREAIGMAGDRRGEMIVHLPRDGDTLGAGHEIGTGARVREHLHGDAGLVHQAQALLADLGREFERLRPTRRVASLAEAAPRDRRRIDPLDKSRNREMLLECDDAHGQSSRSLFASALHGAPPRNKAGAAARPVAKSRAECEAWRPVRAGRASEGATPCR